MKGESLKPELIFQIFKPSNYRFGLDYEVQFNVERWNKKRKKNQFKNFAKEKEITIKNEGGLNHKKINFKEDLKWNKLQ
jgi:hypothetical protein